MRYRKLRIAFSVLCGLASVPLCLFCVQSWSRHSPVPTKARTFGDEQLLQILNDRPAMRGILDPHDYICEWVIREFNATSTEARLYWDHNEPISGRPAESLRAYGSHPAVIRLTSSTLTSPRDKWLMLVYEIHNLKNAKGFESLDRLAADGQIDRNHYSDECLTLEFKAIVETRKFFTLHPIRGATTKSDPFYSSYTTGSNKLDDYKRMLQSNKPGEYNPLDYFGRSYDKMQSQSEGTWLDLLKGLSEQFRFHDAGD